MAARTLVMTSIAVVLLATAPAPAQTSSDATALSLFEDAKKLTADGRYAEACPKLAASYKLASKVGTLMNLADCYEHTGQTASAWARFTEAATLAERVGQSERMDYAKSHAAALVPKLSRLTIRVASPATRIEVTRDGEPVDPAMFGEAVAVDPGSHVVEAKAPGKRPWSGKIEVGADGTQASLDVPQLEDAPRAPPPSASPATTRVVHLYERAPPTPGSAQRTWAWVLGVTGVVVMGAGGVVGVIATGPYHDTDRNCDGDVCNGQGLEERKNAIAQARVGTYVFISGAVLVAGGIVLGVTTPSAKDVHATTTGIVTVGPGSVSWSSSW